MRNFKALLASALLLCLAFSFASCGAPSPSASSVSPDAASAEPAPTVSAAPAQTAAPSAAPDYPLYLPLPTYGVFYGITDSTTDLDSFLQRTAVEYFSMRISDARNGDLIIPTLRLLASWEAEDGDTCYLCLATTANYYSLGDSLRLGTPFVDQGYDGNNTGLGWPVLFKAAEIGWQATEYNYWDYHCTKILELPPSGDSHGDVSYLSKMCEGCPDTSLLDRLESYYVGDIPSDELDYIRDILPADIAHNKAALLKAYLDHFGFQLPAGSDYGT